MASEGILNETQIVNVIQDMASRRGLRTVVSGERLTMVYLEDMRGVRSHAVNIEELGPISNSQECTELMIGLVAKMAEEAFR